MKKLILSFLAFLTALVFAQMGSAATISLYDYAFNIDGAVSEAYDGDPIPGDSSGFNATTGLGTISITVSGAGDHYVGAFFDHEIDEAINTFFNEFGSIDSTSASIQTWEIDEPGYLFGDIYANLLAGTLDNTNAVPEGSNDDVAMAMAWEFMLDTDEEAVIEFILSDIAPDSGFYLAQTDPDSVESIYFYSTLEITDDGQSGGEIPEPSTMILFGVGLLAFARAGRRQK